MNSKMRLSSNCLPLIVVIVVCCVHWCSAFRSINVNQIRQCVTTNTINNTPVNYKENIPYQYLSIQQLFSVHQRSTVLSSTSTRDIQDTVLPTTSSIGTTSYSSDYLNNDVRIPLWTMMPKSAKVNGDVKTDLLLDTELWLGRVAIIAAISIIINEITTHEGIITLLSKIGH
jgi:hypothetical protein